MNRPRTWRWRVIVIVLMGIALVLAWICRFVQDDAFISFVYARALATGHGLTWFGERVEGYTDFLWVLWMALGIRLGVEPILWSQIGGLAAFLVTLACTWKLARWVLDDDFGALLALVLLIGNYSVLAFATGGLETMWQTAFLTGAMLQLVRTQRQPAAVRTRWSFSLLAAGAILTRMDSALPVAIMVLFALRAPRVKPASRRQVATELLVPAGAIVGAWLIWKLLYYNNVLPNTYYAKVGLTETGIRNGFLYLWRYLHGYTLWPVLILGAVLLALGKRRSGSPATSLTPMVAILVAWCAYLILIGGDFMEFRLLIPVSPLLFILSAYLIYEGIGKMLRAPRAVSALVMVALLAASVRHARGFRGITEDQALDSVHALATFYGVYPDEDWGRIGRALKADFENVPVRLALHPAGAIPFYSEIPTIDQYGLNDAHIARHGNPAPPDYARPGHRRHTTLSYLRQRGVNFILAHPTFVAPGGIVDPRAASQLQHWVRIAVSFNRERIGEATLVELPLEPRRSLLSWYLTPTPALDGRIRANGWKTVTLHIPP